MDDRKNVLITGGTSGIGKACAEYFARNGYLVYAASRGASGEPVPFDGGGEIRGVKMDVRDEASVEAAVGQVIADAGRIDIVIHCAGMGIAGAAEDTPMDAAAAQIDTNYFGVLRVNKHVLPHMRENGGGHVIMIGSVAGIFAIPFQSHYSSSKFAVDAYAAALRMETKQYGIRVSLVAPGDTRTGFTAARVYECAEDSVYHDVCLRSVAKMEKDERNGRDPISCARVIYKLAREKNPPFRVIVGFEYKLMAFAKRLLPNRLVESVLGSMYIPK